MAFRHGRNAAFYINSVNLTSFLDTLELPFEVETADTTTFGNNWKSGIPGLIGASISGSGSYDPTNTTGPSSAILAIIGAGTAVTFGFEAMVTGTVTSGTVA